MNNNQTFVCDTFGDFFRERRVKIGMTLRSFCERFGYDPGNVSRIERNILPPSLDEEKLTGYASALQITKGSEEWVRFFDLAYTAKGMIPIGLDKNVTTILPAFFRTMRNKRLNREKMEKLIKILNQ